MKFKSSQEEFNAIKVATETINELFDKVQYYDDTNDVPESRRRLNWYCNKEANWDYFSFGPLRIRVSESGWDWAAVQLKDGSRDEILETEAFGSSPVEAASKCLMKIKRLKRQDELYNRALDACNSLNQRIPFVKWIPVRCDLYNVDSKVVDVADIVGTMPFDAAGNNQHCVTIELSNGYVYSWDVNGPGFSRGWYVWNELPEEELEWHRLNPCYDIESLVANIKDKLSDIIDCLRSTARKIDLTASKIESKILDSKSEQDV
jgi:hypothetical protein